VTVKVPVFSFEKLLGVNSALSPEMKSTGEVLGIGKTLEEALFKGLLSAGFKLDHSRADGRGVFLSVNRQDRFEVVELARKFDELGFKLYATDGNAREIERLGVDVTVVGKLSDETNALCLLEEGKISYLIMTGTTEPNYVNDYIRINRRALQLSIPCLTSLDTANALADMLASRFSEHNTELVDIAHMRTERELLPFAKMQGSGDDYIFFENFDGSISCPESLSTALSDRNFGIGATGVVLIEHSEIADAKMRIFNADGSESGMAGNCIRCVGKYLHDRKIVPKMEMTVETASGIKALTLYSYGGEVRTVRVDMGRAALHPTQIPVRLDGERVMNRKLRVADGDYAVSCVSMGNPHCVVFVDRVDRVDVAALGPLFENDPIFPERVNAEFVRVVDAHTLKMRVWERGNGETLACGTGACAAVVAAVENGFCAKGEDITVKVRGGELVVNYTDEAVTLTGNAKLIYTGTVEL
jgi:carbamoyl-phosphate synthase large subunit